MKAKIICYHFKKITPSKRMMFHKEMYGYKDFSNKGRYVYQRKGILDSIKHKKILDAVIITDSHGVRIIKKVLKKYNARIYLFDIIVPFKL
jgi:hypothetical protein